MDFPLDDGDDDMATSSLRSYPTQIPLLRSASLGVCDFFIFRCSLRPESSQEHLPTSIAGVLRLRAIRPAVCDRSAKRFAQDDGFVGGLKYSWLDMQKTRKIEKVTGSQDDVFVVSLKKNIPNKVALMGLRPGLSSAVPSGLWQQASRRLLGRSVPCTFEFEG